MPNDSNSKQKNRSRRLWYLVLLLSLLLLLGCVIAYIVTHPWWHEELDPGEFHSKTPTGITEISTTEAPTAEVTSTEEGSEVVSTEPVSTEDPSDTEQTPETTERKLSKNPVNFKKLQKVNPDVYAWLYLPMGPSKPDIDLPILQPREGDDENFYLHHDINRKYLFAGCIYTQPINSKDFTDRVTVVYGHNMLDGTYFTNLPVFRDKSFFKKHEFFYIYTPGHILTYRIAATIQFDTRHILNCFDFSDDQVYADWIQNYILSPKTMVRNVREGMEVTIDDKLVILSTCLERGASRYLIQGVLISDEPTK